MNRLILMIVIGSLIFVLVVGVKRLATPTTIPIDNKVLTISKTTKSEFKIAEHSKLLQYNENPTAGNDVLNVLVEESAPNLGEELCCIIFNPQCDTSWRNYCIQHLANYFIRHGGDKYFKAVLEAIDLEERELASTAIFNAARICVERKIVESDEIYALLIERIDDNLKGTRHSHMRIAAIRSIVALGASKYNFQICKIAANEQEELSLRMAAIDAVGSLGIESFERDLEALRLSKVRLLSTAASNALKRLHPLTSVLPADKFSVSTLRVALTSKHSQVRNEAALELRKFGAEALPALPEICSALLLADQNTTEFEVSVFLELIRSFGSKGSAASAAVCSILNERATVLADKEKNTLNRIRAYALVTLADIGVPENSYGYIADALENSDSSMQLNFAAGAYAVSKLGSKGSVFLPFLLRALRPDFGNTRLSLKSYNAGVDEASYTSARIEAIQALSAIGANATGALSLLEAIAKSPPANNCPRAQAAAILAISKIEGVQP